ncbi:MAG: helix-turn-helix domain-containing protein [Hyphomicrobium sp.]|uniref:helix-turn-helix domain-containing protein n=1 Tax=Hyphomicrobium sp. TaxID=82 RepID=UPI003D123E0C
MTTISTGGRTLAIAAGAAFTFGGLRIILGDTLTDPSRWTTSVQLTVLMVFGTIAAGHLMRDAWQAKHSGAALGFLVLFLAGTGLVVFNSVGRQAEATMLTASQADDAAERRVTIKAALARAEAMLTGAQDDLARECKTGKGKRCEGITATIGVYEAAVKGHVADLDKIGPARPVNAKAAEGAKIAALLGADEAKAKAALMLLEPFLWTLFFEVGSIVSLGFAFRHRKPGQHPENTRKLPATVATDRPVTPSEQSDFCTDGIDEARKLGIGGTPGTGNWGNSGNGGGPKPSKSGNGGGARVYSRAEALLDVTRRMASGETVDAQDVLATDWGVDKSTVSKWLKRWRTDGLIPAAQRVGRCHRLVAAE